MMLTSMATVGRPVSTTIVGGLAVERIARVVQLAQAAQRIGHLQQRPLDVVTKPPEQILGRGAQIDHVEMRAQLLAVGLAQNRAAAGGDDSVGRRRELADHRLLDVAKAFFAFAFEEVADRAADALFDHVVAVGERKLQALRQTAADCRLAGAGQSNECDRHALATSRRVSARRCGR